MKDDIETLRSTITHHVMRETPVQREAHAALERVENELKIAKSAAEDYDKDCIDMRYQRDRIEAERDSLRAKLDRAKEALAALVGDIRDYERVNNLSPAPGEKDCWQSAADAPAQQTQISDEADNAR